MYCHLVGGACLGDRCGYADICNRLKEQQSNHTESSFKTSFPHPQQSKLIKFA